MSFESEIKSLMKKAIGQTASDIYFLPHDTNYQIKFHTNNGLVNYLEISPDKIKMMINYFKYHGHMQLTERRRPLVGSLEWQYDNQIYHLRLSTVADFNGNESLVIRIIYPFDSLSTKYLVSYQYEKLKDSLSKRGLIVFAGPTGSGKTTTIYQLAKKLSSQQLVMSIEDPVEIHESSFLQLQVNQDAEMSYADLLKVGLRNRPDIFIIGEIRDSKTAMIAVQAALSGHLVFSTIHAKDALGVIDRLMNLGISYDYLKSCLNMIAYQRLIPLVNQYATLFSLVDNKMAFDNKITKNYLMKEWRNNLDNAYREDKISKQTKTRFWYG